MAAEAGDPRDATYFANLAALEFAKTNTLASDQRGREGAEAGFKYNQGLLQREEPLKLTANRNQANSQGLLESGQLAKRQGETETSYAQKEASLRANRQAAIERFNEGDQRAQGAFLGGQAKALEGSSERARQRLIENPPGAEPATQVPGTSAANTARAGAPGARLYEEPGAGFVRVGGATKGPATVRPPTLRRQAARKVVG